MTPGVVVLGGAGFLGSHVVARFCRAGARVTVVDGLIERTGGRAEHLAPFRDHITFVRAPVEAAPDLPGLLAPCDVLVDAMGWTAHRDGMKDPIRDLRLNAESHLHVLQRLPRREGPSRRMIVYLGSRGQYGAAPAPSITEDTPMVPVDVQGIHKLAAESAYRVLGPALGWDVVSLRLPNCFGPRQPTGDGDIGLVGVLLRDLLAGRAVDVFGGGRRRNLAYAPDVAEVVFRLSRAPLSGFHAFNYAGLPITIEALVERLVAALGRGAYRIREAPPEIARLEVGSATLDDTRLRALLGGIAPTDLGEALRQTIATFEGRTP